MASVVLFRGFFLLSWVMLSSPMRILRLVEGFDWGAISPRDNFSWRARMLDFWHKKNRRLTYGCRLWSLLPDR